MNANEPDRSSGRGHARGAAIAAALAMVASFVTALVVVTPPSAAAATPPIVTTGTEDSCAITSAGAAYCWGLGGYGELGNGTNADSTVPVQVTGLPVATAIDAGDSHVCAIDGTKAPWCWGHNSDGELGTGTNANSWVPVKVFGSLQATQIDAGKDFTCALLAAGTVDCWGRGDEGQIGNGTNSSTRKPKPVTGLQAVKQIAVGGFHACALLTDGGVVKCWGANTFGALGNGTTTASNVPVQATGLTNVQAIAAGGFHTCALLSGGAVDCWGDNFSGEVGDGTNTDRHVPTPVTGLAGGATQISAGLAHTCAVVTNPTAVVECWGQGTYGQLGTGMFQSTNTPVKYLGPAQPPAGGAGTGPVQVAAGYSHTCVSMTTAIVECFGENFDGALGDGTHGDSAVPVVVIGLTAGTQGVGEGGLSGCALTQTLGVKCWGSADGNDFTEYTSAQDVTALPSGIAQLGVGTADACAVSTTGGLSCWGRNDDGEVGVGDVNVPHATPQVVSGIPSPVATVVGGSLDTCAIVKQGAAYCWGDNSHGQIGDGTTTTRSTPTLVHGLPAHVAQIVNNGSLVTGRTCAALKNGKAYCWGDDTDGALGHNGSGQQSLPVTVLGLPNAAVVQLATGGTTSCALMSTGQVWCWGSNSDGQLGNGSAFGSKSTTPVQASLSGTAIQLVGTVGTFCVLVTTGDVYCWGLGSLGTLGNNATSDSNVPVQVVNLSSRAITITGAASSFCALLENPVDAQCWGSNFSGELGDGNNDPSSDVPMPVQGL